MKARRCYGKIVKELYFNQSIGKNAMIVIAMLQFDIYTFTHYAFYDWTSQSDCVRKLILVEVSTADKMIFFSNCIPRMFGKT